MVTGSVFHHAPQYLDDDGGGERCFLRHNLAASRGEAEKIVERMGFEWDFRSAECGVVSMRPCDGVGGSSSDEWYDEVPAGTENAVRYWRWRW